MKFGRSQRLIAIGSAADVEQFVIPRIFHAMHLQHQPQGETGAGSERLRTDGGAAQIGVGLILFAANHA
jgi:hypothetical protein